MSADALFSSAVPTPVIGPPAIEAVGVSVSYRMRIDEKNLIGDVRRLLRRGGNAERVVPAVRDVSFELQKGSVLAVIGRNGAGKSTLLRIIGGILPPETGKVVVRGRLNLLAPGIGMSDALTGRENILLGGLASGMTPERLEELTDEIAEFAQLGEYIDYPIRTYSMGMRMRIAVAVAAHLDPEVLLIDEALAGGDAAFMAHTTQKMAELTGAGRTIVLVTHGLSSVHNMATEAMWMHQGRVVEYGDPDEVVAKYMRYCRLELMDMDDQ